MKGKLLFEGSYLKGERNGKWKTYNKDGKVEYEKEYINGKIWKIIKYDGNNNIVNELCEGKGIIKHYNDEGKIVSECEYLNGEKNGKEKEYFNDGNLKYEVNYFKGKKSGKEKIFDENGQLIIEKEYLKDKLWNIKFYDIYGNIKNEFKNGKGFIKEFDRGILRFEGEYLNGEKNGKGKEYFLNRKLKFEGEYLNGKRNGNGKLYHKNKILKFEDEFLNGERNGKGKEYYKSGELKFEGDYLYNNKIKGKEFIEGKLEYEG